MEYDPAAANVGQFSPAHAECPADIAATLLGRKVDLPLDPPGADQAPCPNREICSQGKFPRQDGKLIEATLHNPHFAQRHRNEKVSPGNELVSGLVKPSSD